MGRLSARQGTAAYLLAGALPFVGTVYPARNFVGEPDYSALFGGQMVDGSGGVLIVNIPSDQREPLTETGWSFVDDFDTFRIVLELFFVHTSGSSSAPSDAIAIQQDYDQMVDALKALIRGDPSFGGTFWTAGMFNIGIQHRQSSVYTSDDGLDLFIDGVVEFEASQQIVAPAGTA